MPTSLIISSSVQPTSSGTKLIGPLTVSGYNNVIAIQNLAFATSDDPVQVIAPYGATGAVVVPPTSNTVGLTLSGVIGDYGINLQPAQPFVITFANPNSNSSFYLTSAGAITGTVEVSFF